ncbi:hypothetical protein CPB83DRAFT_170665 [Crepidotus variabilis]|uniref:Hydrophobin n=1 Tax=Crepidotus variabilis TaxID=179855 RepID=A0A9P6JS78_9AGAR|nr:hypothetical protein CPB83DRAFT_170665 [Crepidotus variabilis]
MKFATFLLTFLMAAASATFALGLSVEIRETNAQRMARGLSPLPPRGLGTRSSLVEAARRSQPSGASDPRCPAGTTYCCNRVKDAKDTIIGQIIGLLGIQVPSGIKFGNSCQKSPPGKSCGHTLACCTGKEHANGLLVIGCNPGESQVLIGASYGLCTIFDQSEPMNAHRKEVRNVSPWFRNLTTNANTILWKDHRTIAIL